METKNTNKRTRNESKNNNNSGPNYGSINQTNKFKRKQLSFADELINNVCKDINKLGENSNLVNQIKDLSYISNPIICEFEKITKLKDAVLSTIYAIIIEQPHKINMIVNLILICNAKNSTMGEYVIQFFHGKIQELLDIITEIVDLEGDVHSYMKEKHNDLPGENAGFFNNIKSILKFIALLSPIIVENSVSNVFKQFLNYSIALQNETPEQRNGIAEQIFFNTLIGIPYLINNLNDPEIINQSNDLIEIARQFKIVDDDNFNFLNSFDSKLGNFEVPYVSKKLINFLLPSLINLQGESKDWCNLRDKLFLNVDEYLQPILDEILKSNPNSNEMIRHEFSEFLLPSFTVIQSYIPFGSVDNSWYKYGKLSFEVYNTPELETVPNIDSYLHFFFKDIAYDILINLTFNKDEVTNQLLILETFFNKTIFFSSGSSIDQLKQIHNDNISGKNNPPLSTLKIEDVIVESILTMIFQLPKSIDYEIFYYTVLIGCCRENPGAIAPVFGRAIRFFYKHLNTLDYELKIRFLDWMTIQISNFDFSWKWHEWIEDSKRLKNLKYHANKIFIKNLIAKEIRLSNKKLIKESFVTVNPENSEVVVLEEFYKYLSVSLHENQSKFIIDYDTDLYQNKTEVKELIAKLYFEKNELLAGKSYVSAQEEIIYIFLDVKLPLHQISKKVYDFFVSDKKLNEDFIMLYNEALKQILEISHIDTHKFLINLFFQTFIYIGSRSIYSTVNIISQEVEKLRFLSGTGDSYEKIKETFGESNLSEKELENRQNWVIESVFRIWSSHAQISLIILEYLIEYDILKSQFLIKIVLQLKHNLIIENVSCHESIVRIFKYLFETKKNDFKNQFLLFFDLVVQNINSLSKILTDDPNQIIKINDDFDENDVKNLELMNNIDRQWLYYNYVGLIKSFYRMFIFNNYTDYVVHIENLLAKIDNVPVRENLLSFVKMSLIKKTPMTSHKND